jgi:hypothetical protein
MNIETDPTRRRVNKLIGGMKMFCARRNTASYVELLNMNELNAKFPARMKRGAKSAHG